MRCVRVPGFRLVACSTVVLVGLSLSGLRAAGAASPPRSVPSSPNPSDTNLLWGVSADSAKDAWAVGEYAKGDEDKTLTLHWNGTNWSRVSSPSPGPPNPSLYAVAAISPANAWAVGATSSGTLILHWDGTKWSRVKSPSPGSDGVLVGVSASATSPESAWAVGSYMNSDGYSLTLALHWNGTKWSRVTSPDTSATDNYLTAVSAPSATDAWVVGGTIKRQHESTLKSTLILHWDGTKWTHVKSPHASGTLNGIGSASSTTGYAAGYDDLTGDSIILSRNGNAWSTMVSPNPLDDNNLLGISVLSSTSAWAVGSWNDGAGDQYVFIAQLAGTIWTPQSPPSNPSSTLNILTAVSAVSASDAWAVGYYVDDGTGDTDTLILHWDGTSWSQQ